MPAPWPAPASSSRALVFASLQTDGVTAAFSWVQPVGGDGNGAGRVGGQRGGGGAASAAAASGPSPAVAASCSSGGGSGGASLVHLLAPMLILGVQTANQAQLSSSMCSPSDCSEASQLLLSAKPSSAELTSAFRAQVAPAPVGASAAAHHSSGWQGDRTAPVRAQPPPPPLQQQHQKLMSALNGVLHPVAAAAEAAVCVGLKRSWRSAAAATGPDGLACNQVASLQQQASRAASFGEQAQPACVATHGMARPDQKQLAAVLVWAARRQVAARRCSQALQLQQLGQVARCQQQHGGQPCCLPHAEQPRFFASAGCLQQRMLSREFAMKQQQQQAWAVRPEVAQQQQQQQLRAAGLPCRLTAGQQLLAWSGSVLRVQCSDAYYMAQHIFKRVAKRMDGELLASFGTRVPAAAAMLICLWIGAKCEDRRRHLVGASTIGKACGMPPSGVSALELYVMQLLDWRPYEGFRTSGPSSCVVEGCE